LPRSTERMGLATPSTAAVNAPLDRELPIAQPTVDDSDQRSGRRDDRPPRPYSTDQRRWMNVRGAYPLLLVGSALLAYGVLVGVQVPTPTIGRFEIWQLVLVIGATVLAAGIFSLFFAEEEPYPPSSELTHQRVPEVPLHAAPKVISTVSAPSSPVTPPPWWEGPPTKVSPPRVVPSVRAGPSARPSAISRQETVQPARESPLEPSSATVPTPQTSEEIASTLKELDAISRDVSATTRPSRPSATVTPRVDRCWDCRRPITDLGAALPCEQCGKQLCSSCAMDSVVRSGAVTCRGCAVSSP
jgi:hypothetical protein